MVPNAMLTQFSSIWNSKVQHSPNSHLLQLSSVQYSANFHLIRNHPNNSHPILICAVIASQYSFNSHQLEMAGANAHLMLIYNFHQIGENWLRIGWELSESWNSFLLGQCFIDAVKGICDKLRNENKLCYLLGGYNINLLNVDTHTSTADFSDAMFSNGFIPLITRPTWVTQSTATFIDNIFTCGSMQHLQGTYKEYCWQIYSITIPHFMWIIC